MRARTWSTSPPNPAPATNPDILIVAKSFKLPKKGKCKPVIGFELASISSDAPQVSRPVSGTACLNFAGTLLRAGFTIHEVYDSSVDNSSAIHPEIAVGMDIPYPALSGGWVQYRMTDQAFGSVRQDVVAGPCQISSL